MKDIFKRSDSEHCFPKNRFSMQEGPIYKRNTLFHRELNLNDNTIQNNR